MSKQLSPPAPRPCQSCPYRRDVPSGVWSESEYAKLPRYDGETGYQDPTVFECHYQTDRLCAGWVAVHDMYDSLGLRLALLSGLVASEDVDMILDYETDVPLFASGAEACAHGMREIERPSISARRIVKKIERQVPGVERR